MTKAQLIQYRRTSIRVYVDYPIRKGRCTVCNRSGLTNLHHWKYAYATKEVKKNPNLALENVIELCFTCHQIGDALRIVDEHEAVVNTIRDVIRIK